jgi:predicted Rossmann-fold nucleotide-binding protein
LWRNASRQIDLPEGAERSVVKNFHSRRTRLFRSPVAFLVLPGGPGTLAEFTELAAWHAAGILDKPVVLLDPDHWFKPVVYFYEKARREKVSKWATKEMFRRVPDIESAEKYLAEAIEGTEH